MPNYVFNTVTAIGNSEVVELLDKAVRSDERPFDFQRIIPMPVIVKELRPKTPLISMKLVSDHPGRNIVDWKTNRWGTKWNACEFTCCVPGRYSFLTAWSPPIPVIEALSSLFPELTISIEFQDDSDDVIQSLTFGANSSEVNAS